MRGEMVDGAEGWLHVASEPTDKFELCSVSNEEVFSDFSAGE